MDSTQMPQSEWLTRRRATCQRWWHKWSNKRNLNSGFYHHGALGRDGKLCLRCFAIEFPESNHSFFNALPSWLKNDPELSFAGKPIPEAWKGAQPVLEKQSEIMADKENPLPSTP